MSFYIFVLFVLFGLVYSDDSCNLYDNNQEGCLNDLYHVCAYCNLTTSGFCINWNPCKKQPSYNPISCGESTPRYPYGNDWLIHQDKKKCLDDIWNNIQLILIFTIPILMGLSLAITIFIIAFCCSCFRDGWIDIESINKHLDLIFTCLGNFICCRSSRSIRREYEYIL